MDDTVKALKICFSIQGILILIAILGFGLTLSPDWWRLLPLIFIINHLICTKIYWKPLKCELTEISPKYEQWFDPLTNNTMDFLAFALGSSMLDSEDMKRARLHVRLTYLLGLIIFAKPLIIVFVQVFGVIFRQA